jgi:hypothetical protein
VRRATKTQVLLLQHHATGDFNALGVDPAVVTGHQGSNHGAYVVGLTDAAQGFDLGRRQ